MKNSLLHRKSERKYDTIPYRIDSIKNLLDNKALDPMVNFDLCETENYIVPKSKSQWGDDSSDESTGFKRCDSDENSNDTRHVLQKKVHDFYKIINQIGGKLLYIKSGTTGHTFKGIATTEDGHSRNYAVKVVAYPKRKRYGNLYNIERPENAELLMIRALSYFVVNRKTPHIVLPIATFDTCIRPFTKLIRDKIVDEDNKKYKEFVKKYKEGQLYDNVSILISEWANKGDLLDFIRKNYKEFQPIDWKVFFFQVISVLAVIQYKYPSFRHNDLKANNVLVNKISINKKKRTRFSYTVNKKRYIVPNIGYQVKLWDFDFACIPGIVNNSKVNAKWTDQINVKPVQNRYYDMHYFFNTLIKKGFFPQFMKDSSIPQDAKDFVNRIVPLKYQKVKTKYVSERGRILINNEYKIPDEVLKTDPYFEEFRRIRKSKRSNRPKIVKNDIDKILFNEYRKGNKYYLDST
jgi:hypothetical protein